MGRRDGLVSMSFGGRRNEVVVVGEFGRLEVGAPFLRGHAAPVVPCIMVIVPLDGVGDVKNTILRRLADGRIDSSRPLRRREAVHLPEGDADAPFTGCADSGASLACGPRLITYEDM